MVRIIRASCRSFSDGETPHVEASCFPFLHADKNEGDMSAP